MYALLHQMESEQRRRVPKSEADDWLDGVKTGEQAEKARLIVRLHWLIDPNSKAVDMENSGLLTARLNQRLISG